MQVKITVATSNSSCSIHYTLKAIEMLQNAIKQALTNIDTMDKSIDGVRKLINGVNTILCVLFFYFNFFKL